MPQIPHDHATKRRSIRCRWWASRAAEGVFAVGIGKTGPDMFVLHRAGRWFAELLESFDNALLALDHDVEAESTAT